MPLTSTGLRPLTHFVNFFRLIAKNSSQLVGNACPECWWDMTVLGILLINNAVLPLLLLFLRSWKFQSQLMITLINSDTKKKRKEDKLFVNTRYIHNTMITYKKI